MCVSFMRYGRQPNIHKWHYLVISESEISGVRMFNIHAYILVRDTIINPG